MAAEVRLSTPGLAVFSEIAYPGWIPYVSPSGAPRAGRPLVALRAFGLLRAVALPAGQWRIEWRYEPASVRLGGWLTMAAVLGLTLILTSRKFRSYNA